jgi:hypothetical protein
MCGILLPRIVLSAKSPAGIRKLAADAFVVFSDTRMGDRYDDNTKEITTTTRQ